MGFWLILTVNKIVASWAHHKGGYKFRQKALRVATVCSDYHMNSRNLNVVHRNEK